MEVSIPARFSTPHVTQIPRSGSRDCACRYKCNSSSSRKFNNWYGGHFESACFALQQDHLYQIENKYVVYIMHPNVHIPFNCIVAVLLNDFIRSTRSIFIRPAYPHSHCFCHTVRPAAIFQNSHSNGGITRNERAGDAAASLCGAPKVGWII